MVSCAGAGRFDRTVTSATWLVAKIPVGIAGVVIRTVGGLAHRHRCHRHDGREVGMGAIRVQRLDAWVERLEKRGRVVDHFCHGCSSRVMLMIVAVR